jgi:glycosyltransferase involved in cell wall biosynthesis
MDYQRKGQGDVKLLGWVNSPSELYNQCSIYVQPSITEGFGCEVLEAMAHGRLVLCSTGAGAADVLPHTCRFEAGNVDHLAAQIDLFRTCCNLKLSGEYCKEVAKMYTWDIIKKHYIDLWSNLL